MNAQTTIAGQLSFQAVFEVVLAGSHRSMNWTTLAPLVDCSEGAALATTNACVDRRRNTPQCSWLGKTPGGARERHLAVTAKVKITAKATRPNWTLVQYSTI